MGGLAMASMRVFPCFSRPILADARPDARRVPQRLSRENASQPVAERWLRVWWLLTWGCVGMAIGALHHIGQENRIQLGGEFQHTLTASLYFGLAIAGGVELAMWGPCPR
jgi:hypothetical protein